MKIIKLVLLLLVAIVNISAQISLITSFEETSHRDSLNLTEIPVDSIRILTRGINYISVQEVNVVYDQFEFELFPQNANNQDITWISSDDNIATIDEYGTVIGISEGVVTITATSADGQSSDSHVLNVVEQFPLKFKYSDAADEFPFEEPGAGKRVRVQPPEYADTDIWYTVYLPETWSATSGKLYPVFVDFVGNGNMDGKTGHGFSNNACFGQFLAYEHEGIHLAVPQINKDGTQQTWWWGDDGEAAVQLMINSVRKVCEDYNGNPGRVIATGFSRGATSVNYMGNYSKETADIWRGYFSYDHFDGHRTINGGSFPELWTGPNEFFDKFPRTNGRPFLIANSSVPDVYEFLTGEDYQWRDPITPGTQVDFVGTNNEFPKVYVGELTFLYPDIVRARAGQEYQDAHHPYWLMTRLDDAQFVFDWVRNTFNSEIGVHHVSGRVTDGNGNPMEGAIVEGGGIHFARTNANGEYFLEGLPQGQRTISYKGTKVDVNLTANITDLNFQ